MGAVAIEQVYEQIREMAKQHGAEKVVLFGSRARGTNGPRSDIDLAIYGCRDFDKLYDCLQEDLWSLLKLDIINMDSRISEELKAEIKRDGVVLYEKI
ncbi:MAG: nucleotidyltransferase domain-containing protein [Roseburia sp.]|nr:nucleotidyltransferase domain-containing protein [Roseburia sp.]